MPGDLPFSRTVIATTGERFSGFAPYAASVNDAGMVAFQATLREGGSGVFTGSARTSLATFSRRSSAGPMVCGFPCVMTAARRTASADRRCDPVVDVVGELGLLTVNEVEKHFPVAFGAG